MLGYLAFRKEQLGSLEFPLWDTFSLVFELLDALDGLPMIPAGSQICEDVQSAGKCEVRKLSRVHAHGSVILSLGG